MGPRAIDDTDRRHGGAAARSAHIAGGPHSDVPPAPDTPFRSRGEFPGGDMAHSTYPAPSQRSGSADRSTTADHRAGHGSPGGAARYDTGRERPPTAPVLDPTTLYLSRPPTWDAAPGHSGGPSGRPAAGTEPSQPGRTPRSAAAGDVRRAVEVTLRLVLEVLDRRRRPQQLASVAARSVVDSVGTIARTAPPGRNLGTAALRRIHITPAGDAAAEVCATYVRGRRTLAIAGRFEYRRGWWICTALHLA